MLPTTSYTPLPLDGSLDIFQAFEFQSTKNPDHALFRYDSESASDGYEEITWSRAVKMFDTTAQILRHRLTETDYTPPPVVGILAATSSIPYAALVFGALRAGCTVFPLSTRNSDVATAHLIAESGIRYLLVSSDGHMQEIARKATALLKARSLHVDITPIPTYEEIFTTQGADLDALPPAPPIDDERIILIAHSSGSTSFPKVIPLTQRHLQSMVQAVGGSDLSSEVRSAQASAMFHAAGFMAIARAAYTGMTLAFFPPTTNAEIPTPERVLGSALATKCTTLGCSPVFLEHWVKSPVDVNKLRTFSCVLFGGGPLAQVVGDTLEAYRVNLLAVYGSTETGGISAVKKHGGGWQYFELLPTTLPVLVPVDGDLSESLFQLIIKDCTTNRLAASNMEIDGVPAFDTKDIVQQHPTNPKLYRVYARVDNQIMHSNGEKTNPGPLEEILVQNSLIKAAIFFGRLKPHAGVLVTPSENAVNLELFRDAIWPTVEQANQFAPAHSRLFKNMIIVSDPSKPFQATAKGTLRRNAILEDYAQEIEDAYADFDSTSSSFSTVGFVGEISMKATLEIVRGHVHANIRSDISDEEDIFEAGGDSLLAARIRAGIIQSLRGPALKIPDTIIQFLPQDLVFTSPTISSLSACIYELITRHEQDHGLKNTRHEAVSVSILDQKDCTIVRLCDSGDTPLILVHGGSGDVYCYRYMQARFKTGLWAIQVTKDTPRTSFIAQTDFYYQKIKESQPRGPYRIGGYSAGTFMACRIAILLEENGDEVVQLALIDSSPFMHFFPHPEVDESINFNDPRSLHDHYDRSVRNYCKVALTWDPWWHKFSEIIWERWNDRVRDEDMPELMANAYHNLFDGLPRIFEFMLSLTAGDPKGHKELIAALVGWMKELRAPVTLYKSSNGAASKIPPELREKWRAFGMDWSCKNIRVVEVAGDHCSIVHSDRLVDDLQKFPGVESREVEA